MDWKGEEDYGATLFRGMVLFAPKTAVVGLNKTLNTFNTSTCQQVKFESYNEVYTYLVTSN